MIDRERFHRQLPLIGEEGQKKIEQTRVILVGLGGLGSHVAQQLVYLGVQRFTLIDRDTVSHSNLNRLIGATEADWIAEAPKVEVAARLLRQVRSSVEVELIRDSFISEAGFAAAEQADFIFACVDRDGVRLILTELSAAYERPYLDVATDIHADEHGLKPGGRIILATAGHQCLVCKGELSQEAIRQDLMTSEERAEDGRIYGVPRSVLGGSGPAVVSVNGVAASLAVTEFMAFVTGFRPVREHLEYDGRRGTVQSDNTPPLPDCYYCKGIYGRRDAVSIDRYVREGFGNRL